MKRIIIIFCLSIVSLTMSAQFGPGSEPRELEFKHTTFVEGMSKQDLEKKANKWMELVGRLEASPYIHYYSSLFNYDCYLQYVFDNKFRLSLDKFIPGGGKETIISFLVAIECKSGSYMVRVFHIDPSCPKIGMSYLRGENGALYPGLYNKRELKNSVPIIGYVMDRADEIFSHIDDYMLN